MSKNNPNSNNHPPKQVEEKPRLLHKRSHHGYTSDPMMALHGEPEAVSKAYQAQLAREARMRRAIDRQLAWRQEKEKILDSLATIRTLSHGGHRTGRCVRNLERELKALGIAFAAEAETGGP
jgi:hypothetical protein